MNIPSPSSWRTWPALRPAYAIEGTESQPVLLLEYIQGQSLTEIIHSNSLDMDEKLRLAVNVAVVLNRIHDQQVMHKDISSGNILVADNDMRGSQDGVYIIDFGIASIIRQENPSHLAPDDTMVGTLAYISPEQTGRMNRQVDYRTDLYSLGVIMYELFTGQLPFEIGDPLEMIHAHIARQPRPPHDIDTDIPGPVSDIILKLLAKNAEDRYQTADGLQTDLERCLEQWQHNNRIESFALGSDDFTGRLQIPQKLYGRQEEVGQLLDVLARAVAGSAQLLFVAGYSGVGKTALVHEIQKDVITKNAAFIEGKFDQLQRTLPYSAWAQAFTQLVNHWLTESETSLTGWRETILEAVGNQGQILIDIIPALEHIIGPQPEVPELGGVESQNRFNYIFNRFINSLATREHPLVVFLDDLQWIDPASLNLIQSLLTVQTASSILIIGAYRNNEVGPDHSLTVSQEKMREEGRQISSIVLQDLSLDDTNQLLADTLHLTVDDCSELSRALVEKTAGNPFYFRQQLFALESEELLSFDREQRRWVWEEDLQQSLQAGGNVVDLMIRKIKILPVETQRTLSMAACIGSRFKASTLDTITGRSHMDILANLNPAMQDGLIVRSNGYFSFVHDRVHEAGYSLIPKPELPRTHLEIGRLLLEEVTEKELDEEIFAIVGHLNAGRALIDTDSEKVELARLNLKAGQKAKAAAAFSDAKQYVEIGLDLIGPDSWQKQYELTLSLHNENGELASLRGQYDQIAPTVDLIRVNAKSIYDQMDIYMTQIEAETSQYNFAEALEIGLDLLRTLGVEIPEQPTAEDIQRFNKNLLGLLTTKPIERVAELGEMTDERALAACSLFAAVMSTAYIVNPPLLPVMAFLGATFTMEYGLNAWAPLSFGNIPMLAFASIKPDTPSDEASKLIQFNKQLVEATHQMLDNPVTAPSRTKGLMMLAFVTPWIKPIEQGIELAQATFQNGFESGDLLYASYGAYHFAMQGFAAGMNLELYQSLLSEQTESLIRVGQKTTPQYLSIYLQTTQNFQKASPKPDKLKGAYLNEDEWLPAAQAANDLPGLHNFSINKLILMYHFGLDEALAGYAGEVEDFLAGGPGFFTVPLVYLYLALAKLRLVDGASSKERRETMNFVDKSLRWVEIWSQSVPATFQHKFDLISAEKSRVLGDVDGALSHYEKAIKGAKESGFTHEEALANELYARFWAERDNDRFAGPLMREAHTLYQKWGATAKAEHLSKRYPNWLIGRSIVVDKPGTQIISDELTGDLDLLTVLKASQDIATEISLENLLVKLMDVIIKNAGAQNGFLILEKEGQWVIEAEGDIDASEIKVLQARNIDLSDLVSAGIINYVAHTKDNVVLDNAVTEGRFKDDPTVKKCQSKSILCFPLLYQGKVEAILYLQNNLSTGSFTPERVELLKMLSSQIVITLINAKLYYNLEKSEEKFRGVFDSMIDVFTRSDINGNCLIISPSIYNILGYKPEEILGKNLADFYADPEQRTEVINKLQATKEVENFEIDIVRKDGKIVTISTNAKVYYNSDGEPLGVEGNIRDITEKKKLEEERYQSEQRYQALSEASFEAIFISEKGVCLEQNSQAEKMFGYTLSEAVGRKGTEWIVPEDREMVMNKMLSGYDAKPYEATALRKDGSTFPCEIKARMMHFKGSDVRVTALYDITERRKAEEALQESEEKFRTLVTNTEEIIYIIAKDGTFLLSEGKGLSKLGLKAGEVVGMSVFDLYKDFPAMLDKMRLAFNGETVTIEHEVGDIYFKSWYTPHLNQKGDIIGLLGLAVNITEQKKAANDILEYQNRLKALANELILAEENQRLEIATGLHDNVGTLLAASRLQIAALNNTLDKEDILDELKLISNGFLKAIESTRSVIFELSPPTLNEFGLSAALSDWIDKELDAKYGIKYKISSENKKYQINMALRSLIFRCSRELLINVIKHARASLVKVNILEKNEKLIISIHDNGSGFSYNPGSLKLRKLGFGLFSVQERINSLGGEMLIDTAIGEGTKVVLKVPVNN